jgi:hypothetical protein
MMGVLFVFTLPLLAISLLIAFIVACTGKGVWAYVTLALVIVVNAPPGLALTQEIATHGHDLVGAIIHAAAYLALLVPPFILYQRVRPPAKPERRW